MTPSQSARRLTTWLCGLFLCSVGAAQSGQNVLLVIADDLGVDQVAAYAEGSSPANTAILDSLSGRGVLFRNAWAYPTCTPTRACINTGRYGFRTGIGEVGGDLGEDEFTLPERLDATGSGYAHAWIGKWHLGRGRRHANDAGWSHFAGLTGGGVSDYYSWQRTVNGQSSTSTTYATTQIADDAIAWIQAQTQPWVCVLAFNAPHTPFHAPPASLHSQTLTGTPEGNPIPHYKAAVEAMDTELGRVLTALGPALARTNVLFIGDNGTPRAVTEAPFVRNAAKGSAYEGGVRVPLIVAGPAVTAGGREEAAVVSAVDLLATIGDLVGRELRPALVRSDSVSFASYLAQPQVSPIRDAIYAESFAGNADPFLDGFAVARGQDYKLVRRYAAAGGFTEELYHLPTDRFERSDLFVGGLSPTEQNARDALAAHIDQVRDTSGTLTTYGQAACVGSRGALQIGGTGTPTVNGVYQVQLMQAPSGTPALLAVGSSRETFAGTPLPFDLGPLGAGPGCVLYASADVAILGATTDTAGTAQLSIRIPNDALFLGASIFHSWVLTDPGASAPLVATQGLRAVVGR